MEAEPNGQTASPSGDAVPRSFAPDETLSPTATEKLLESGGANIYVLSKDPELFAAIKIAAGNRVPVHVIWSFGELRRHAERGECKIVLLDADLFEGDLRSWIEELGALEPTLVMLVAAPRSAEDGLTELLSERLVYRVLTKPAEVPIARTLLDVAVSRYLLRCEEVAASVTAIDAARDAVTAAGNDVPAPRNDLLALRQAALQSAPIRVERREPVATAKTYWPAWLLPVGLVGAIGVAAFIGDFPLLEPRGPISENADVAPEPIFAEPIDVEAPPADQVVGGIEEVFLPEEPAADAETGAAEVPADAPSAAPASTVVPEAALASEPPIVDDTAALAPPLAEPSAASPSAVEPPAAAPPAPEPATVPAATAPTELEGVLATAWSRLRENALLAPAGDSARDYVARATELAPDAPDVLAIRLLLADAVADAARAALESGDFAGAEALADEAFRLGASDETLAVLDLDLAAAREVAARRASSELLELGVARIREDRLIAPENDSALDYLRRLRAASPDHPGLDSAWQSLGEALANKVEESGAAGDWAGAEAWLEPLALVAAPTTIEPLRAEVDVGLRQAAYLATPAADGELLLLTSVAPVYPQEARRRRITGWVDVELIVGTDGIPHEARVVTADPPATFDEAALTAVSRYRYEPFERDGLAYERLARVRIPFDLD
jgi:protein TonB